MKMNCIYWLRRILACIAIFSLTVATFGIQPVQASPPAAEYWTLFVWIAKPRKWICQGKSFAVTVYYQLFPLPGYLATLQPVGDAAINIAPSANLGTIATMLSVQRNPGTRLRATSGWRSRVDMWSAMY